MKPIIRNTQRGRTVALVGDVYRFLATGEDTNFKYALIEALVSPGGGPPPARFGPPSRSWCCAAICGSGKC
jgi:hypothetical protein